MPEKKATKAITYPEIAFLMLLLALFVAGTIWVVHASVLESRPAGSDVAASSQAAAALDRTQALLEAAVLLELPEGAVRAVDGGSTRPVSRLALLADLDGDPTTGSYRAAGRAGLERVSLQHHGTSLVAYVSSGPGGAARRVVLTDELTPRDAEAFTAAFQLEKTGGRDLATRSRVTLSAGSVRGAVTLEGDFGLPARPPVEIPTP